MFILIAQGSDEYIAALGCSLYALRAIGQSFQAAVSRQQVFVIERRQ